MHNDQSDCRPTNETDPPCNIPATGQLETALHRWIKGAGNDLPNIFAVGGAVRDHLLGRRLNDVDIACRCAEKTAAKIAASRPFQTTTVTLEKKPHAPCFRVINKTAPNDFIDVVDMQGVSIRDDLCRRDFTINAMAAEIQPDGQIAGIVDPLAGLADLTKQRIRICRPDCFVADPLRMFRAFRLAAVLDFTISPETMALVKKHHRNITQTAFERITAEFFALLSLTGSFPFIQMMDQTGLLDALFPEIPPMRGCRQNAYHHLDVWEHALSTMANCETILSAPEHFFAGAAGKIMEIMERHNAIALLKLGALFHDAGKPPAKRFDAEKRRPTFHGHADIGANMAKTIAERMKLSVRDGQRFTTLVAHHMRPHELAKPGVKKTTAIKWFRRLGDSSIAVLVLAAADCLAKRGKKTAHAEKDQLLKWICSAATEYLDVLKPQFDRPTLLTGNDLLEMGMAPGPAMGRLLAKIRTLQDEGTIQDREAALSTGLRMLQEGKHI
ncbi:MAG: HD domain-containing protein [Thermodesulfobacteriota bacterium]|nr:HD domain-containing protein [Thermodesulfobacteriota bacterium]